MLKKFLVHPDKGASYGRWIVAGKMVDGELFLTQGPTWLTGNLGYSEPQKLFIEYPGDLEPQELSRERHLELCAELGHHERKIELPVFSTTQSSFSGAAFGASPQQKKEPLTIAGFVEKQLYGRGLFENDAKAIVAALKETPTMKDTMRGRWDEPADAYPQVLLAGLMMHADAAALKWIDKNCPQHWARPMFTGELDAPSLDKA